MGFGTGWYKKAVLSAAGNRAIAGLAQRYGGKLAARFVAGERREDALRAAASLNGKGIICTIDHLGEGVRRLEEAAAYREEYVRLVGSIAERGAVAHVSLKPTQMGLALDAEAAFRNVREVVAAAREANTFVRVDMENSPYTQATLDLVRRLHAEGLRNVGAVLQAYLHRSMRDAIELTQENIGLRLVKGAYREPRSIAYQRAGEIIANLRGIAGELLRRGAYVAIGSHDDRVIGWMKSFAAANGVAKDAFEFQMLYGLRTGEQEKLAAEGYRVRCYVPYGAMWYPYFTRRLAEKPGHLWLVVRHAWK